MKKVIFILVVFLFPFLLFAQTNDIEWQKCLGGSDYDYANSIQQTADGGYIVAGYTKSNDGDVSENYGDFDAWIVKLNESGDIEWEKNMGGSADDVANSIQQTTDGGYIVAGWTNSNDSDVSGNHGSSDIWIVKLNATGDTQWTKCLGGSFAEYASVIQQTSDGEYIITGYTSSNNGDVSGNHGGYDFWMIKLNESGNILWQKCLGGSNDDQANSIQQTTDGGYVVAGYTESNNGDVSGNHGKSDYWIVKLDTSNTIEWQKCLGGSDYDYNYSVQQTSDNGYITTGSTKSTDGDVSGIHSDYYNDIWVVKLNSTGDTLWTKCLGGVSEESSYSVIQNKNNDYIITGLTHSTYDDVSGNHGGYDAWIVNLNESGTIQWQKCIGGKYDDYGYYLQQTTDGGYIMAGYTYSNDGDISGNHGSIDLMIVKLSKKVSIEKLPYNLGTISIYPNPMNDYAEIEIPNRNKGKQVSAKIIDIKGKTVKEFNAIKKNKLRIQKNDLKSGVYQVIISVGKKMYMGKLIVK